MKAGAGFPEIYSRKNYWIESLPIKYRNCSFRIVGYQEDSKVPVSAIGKEETTALLSVQISHPRFPIDKRKGNRRNPAIRLKPSEQQGSSKRYARRSIRTRIDPVGDTGSGCEFGL